MTQWKLLLLTCAIVFGSAVSEETHDVYDYEIDSEGHAMEGYLFPDLESGDRILVNLEDGETLTENGNEVKYIRLKIRKSRNTSGPAPIFRVFDTEHFSVNKDNYIVVDTNNTAKLQEEKELKFYVVLTNNHRQAVSNPLPFIVRIEKKTENPSDYSLHSAIFAGVLVLIIVILALGIPFGIRAKRRMKRGKPVMKLGSHPGSSPDLKMIVSESVEDIPGMRRNPTEPNWYGENTILSYEQEVKTEKAAFTKEIKQLEKKISLGFSKEADDDDDGLVKRSKEEQKGILKNGNSSHDNGQVTFSVDVHGANVNVKTEQTSKL